MGWSWKAYRPDHAHNISLAINEAAVDMTKASSSFSYESGYYFVDNPADDVLCPVCLEVLVEPYMVGCCGNHFCKNCIENLKSNGTACPICRTEKFTIRHDKYFKESTINQLLVRCNGCSWYGELGAFNDHVKNECLSADADCRLGCGERIERRWMEVHTVDECVNRIAKCKYCQEEGRYGDLVSSHLQVCLKYPIPCPNQCGVSKMERWKASEHCNFRCPLQKVVCEFAHAGCEVKLLRKHMSEHLLDFAQFHLAMVSNAVVVKHGAKIEQMQQQLQDRDATIVQLCDHIEKLTARIQFQEAKLDRLTNLLLKKSPELEITAPKEWPGQNWISPSFDTHNDGYRLCFQLSGQEDVSSENVSCSTLAVGCCLMRGSNDSNLQWPFKGAILIRLLNQAQDNNHLDWFFDYSGTSLCQANQVEKKDISTPLYTSFVHHHLRDDGLSLRYVHQNVYKFRVIIKAII